jgi:uncharacterized membrane protein YccC
MEEINLKGLSLLREPMAESTRRIIYLSLATIVGLAIVEHLTRTMTISIATLLVLMFIVIGNIGYLYRRFRKSSD